METEKTEVTEPTALNPSVVKLGFVSFFTDVASDMLYPITPIFLTATLGASMFSVGLIEGIAEAISSVLKTIVGQWSDRLGRRKVFIMIGYFLSAISKPLTGIASQWTDVLLARGIDRTGKGIRTTPRDALLSESVPAKIRGAAFGWHRLMDTLGAVVGPLATIAYLSYEPTQLRPLFFWAVIPGLISVVIVLGITEQRKSHYPSHQRKLNFDIKQLPRSFHKYLFCWGAFSLTNSSDAFLLLKAKESGSTLIEVTLFYCFYNLVYALTSPYLAGLSDRVGRKKLLIFGLIVFACVYVGFAWANSAWQFWILFGIYGIYMGATDGAGKAFAVDLVPGHLKATGLGVLATVTGLATIIASAAAGLLWDHVNSRVAMLYGVSGSLLAVTLLSILFKTSDQSQLRT